MQRQGPKPGVQQLLDDQLVWGLDRDELNLFKLNDARDNDRNPRWTGVNVAAKNPCLLHQR